MEFTPIIYIICVPTIHAVLSLQIDIFIRIQGTKSVFLSRRETPNFGLLDLFRAFLWFRPDWICNLYQTIA